MTERTPLYDRVLVLAALLAPFALIVLAKWRSSLEMSYAPIEPGMAQVFGATFETRAAAWLRETPSDGARLVLLVDGLDEGLLKTESWEKDGQKMYTTEILASSMQMLGSSGDQKPATNGEQRTYKAGDPVPEEAGSYASKDDLPF